MALRFFDGMDHYDTSRIQEKWGLNQGGAATIVNPGRFAYGGCFQIVNHGAGVQRGIANNMQDWVVGAAFNFSLLPGVMDLPLIWVVDTLSNPPGQCGITLDDTGRLKVWRGDAQGNSTLTLLAYSEPAVIPAGSTWLYLELKVHIHSSGGTVAVRLNGLPIPSLPDISGVNTQKTPNAFADTLMIQSWPGNGGTSGTITQVDDIYVCDTSGAHNNDFLGPVRIQARLPTADGFHEDWAQNPSQGAGNNWKNVNQNPPDDDTTYQSSATPGQIDTYTYASLVNTPQVIKGVQTVFDARKDDAGGRLIANLIRAGGVDYVGPTNWNIADSYQFYSDPWDVNPGTGNAFSVAEANAIEAGYKEIA